MSLSFLLSVIVYPLTGNYTCVEWGNCTLTGHIFDVAFLPYQWSLGAFAFVGVWGILLVVIWKVSQSVMLVGIVGLVLNVFLVSFYAPAREIGFFMLAISAGITLYWLFILRPHGGSPS